MHVIPNFREKSLRNGKYKSISLVTPHSAPEIQQKKVNFPLEYNGLASIRILQDPDNQPGPRKAVIKSHNKPLTTLESILESRKAKLKLKRKLYSNVIFGNSNDEGAEEEQMKRYGLGYDQPISRDHLRLSDSNPDMSDEEADSPVITTAYLMAKEVIDSRKMKRVSSSKPTSL